MTPNEAEAERIRAEYARREREIERGFYSLTRPSNLFIRHGQERALLRGLERAGLLPLADKRIVEVGCGSGQWLDVFENFGAQRENIAGIDLEAKRLEAAAARFAGADLRTGDASSLPWAASSFDIVFQSTMFTSIFDADVRRQIAAEMRRVLRRGGTIVWYDFRYDNPANKGVRGVTATEIARLFPDCEIKLEPVTLAPPIARRMVPLSWLAASLLERLRILNTHLLGVITPR